MKKVSAINQIIVPLMVSKRGRGHFELLSSVNIESSSDILTESVIPYIFKLRENVVNKDDSMQKVVKEMLKDNKISQIDITASFNYPFEKISPDLDIVIYSFPCKLFLHKSANKTKLIPSLSMNVPIILRLDSMTDDTSAAVITINGNLTITLDEPISNFYFEDLLDIVQKHQSVILLPVFTSKNKDTALEKIRKVSSTETFLQEIRKVLKHRRISKSGSIEISFGDINQQYEIVQKISL